MARHSISKAMRTAVCDRDGWRCWYCGVDLRPYKETRYRWRSIHIDHLTSVKAGGANEFWDYVTSCMLCNIQKRDKGIDEFRARRKKNLLYYVNLFEREGLPERPDDYIEQLAYTICAQRLVDLARRQDFKMLFYGEGLWEKARRAV